MTGRSCLIINYLNRGSLRPVVPVVEVDCVVVDPAVVEVVAGGRQVTYKFKATLIYDN